MNVMKADTQNDRTAISCSRLSTTRPPKFGGINLMVHPQVK